ncbi:peptidase S15 [Gemmatimonadetes bacterium T265]|nr:peptidase S15 [Gemmatimonadetes bacterium T265]
MDAPRGTHHAPARRPATQRKPEDGPMIVDRNVRIPRRDGPDVVADVFRPDRGKGRVEQFPVLVTVGVYGKDVPFRVFNPKGWERSELKSGEGPRDYIVGETPLPDFWVRAGYAVVRCDQPGSGDSPGDLDVFGPAAQAAFYDAVEWAGTQSWSTGKVGVFGASYYGVMGWLVAGLRPPHLAAFLPFQGFTDHYRDCMRHGGILTAGFVDSWYGREVLPRQFGAPTGTSGAKLSADELTANTAFPKDYREYLRDDALRYATHEYYRARTPDPAAVTVPVFAWANDDGFGLHLRGTIEGFGLARNAAFCALYAYSGTEPDSMYSTEFSDIHRRFFDRFLKGEENGFEHEPRVRVTVRKDGRPFAERRGTTYPLDGTEARRFYLECGRHALLDEAPGDARTTAYRSEYGSDGVVQFCTPALERDLEIVGPMRLHLTVSADGPDADLFVAVRELRPDGSEVVAASGSPIALSWQRVSMRHADPAQSSTFRTWHTYDRTLPLDPGVPVTLDVNLWPAAWIVAAGNRLAIEIGGNEPKGAGEYTHPPAGPYASPGRAPLDNGAPAPAEVRLHSGGEEPSYVVLPVVPA